MDYVKLGNTGVDVSRICLGCMSFGAAEGWDWAGTTKRLETDPIAKSKYDATAEADKLVVERLAEVAEKHGTARAQIALAWMLHKEPVVAPVIGATKIAHLESAIDSLSVQLTPEDMAYLEEPYVPHDLVGLIPYNKKVFGA